MNMDRRHFLFLTAGIALTGASQAGTPSADSKTINVGAASQYTADGVYIRYRDVGVFIVRRGEKLFALSSYCTHRKCKLKAEGNHTFYCPCHGSTFDPDGHVTKGPARRDLPVLSISSNDSGQLVVQTK